MAMRLLAAIVAAAVGIWIGVSGIPRLTPSGHNWLRVALAAVWFVGVVTGVLLFGTQGQRRRDWIALFFAGVTLTALGLAIVVGTNSSFASSEPLHWWIMRVGFAAAALIIWTVFNRASGRKTSRSVPHEEIPGRQTGN